MSRMAALAVAVSFVLLSVLSVRATQTQVGKDILILSFVTLFLGDERCTCCQCFDVFVSAIGTKMQLAPPHRCGHTQATQRTRTQHAA